MKQKTVKLDSPRLPSKVNPRLMLDHCRKFNWLLRTPLAPAPAPLPFSPSSCSVTNNAISLLAYLLEDHAPAAPVFRSDPTKPKSRKARRGLTSKVPLMGGMMFLNRFKYGSQRLLIAGNGCLSHGMLGNQLSKTRIINTPL